MTSCNLVCIPCAVFSTVDNNQKYDYSYCSYQELHIDYYNFNRNGCYTIEVLDIHPNLEPNLVHWVNNKFVISTLTKNQIITFRANRRHGLLPNKVAEEILLTQSIKPNNHWYKTLDQTKELPAIKFRFLVT